MEAPNISTIKTAGEAEQLAIDWQSWTSEQNLSYGELAEWSTYFHALADKFDLTEIFNENGIL